MAESPGWRTEVVRARPVAHVPGGQRREEGTQVVVVVEEIHWYDEPTGVVRLV